MQRVLVWVLAGTLAAGSAVAQTPREIIVTGEGRVDVAPDLATVSAGVETQGDTAEAALAENARRMTAIIEAIVAAGIAREDVQTNQLGLFPIYREQEGGGWTTEVLGYTARNMVRVRVRDVARLGAALDAVAAAGANLIEGISFDVADRQPHLDSAREQAVADARAKAELLAGAAGVSVGEVLSIRETQAIDQPFPMARAEMAMDSAIAAGTVELDALVEIVFAIAGGEG